MTRTLSYEHRCAIAALLVSSLAIVALSIFSGSAVGAEAIADRGASEDPGRPVDEGRAAERVVVVPEPGRDPGGWYHSSHYGGLEIRVWNDRGEGATYAPGDPLWVYFRVNRSCHVTIVDHAPDGRVSVLFPNRWSGSNYVHAGRTYRVPGSRDYALRIAGPGGVETIVACAHESPWPSGVGGMWIPPAPPWPTHPWWRSHRPPRHGRVVVGGGQGGRVVVGSERYWPAPPAWHDRPRTWATDSVSFYVEDAWYGGDHNGPWGTRLLLEDDFRMRRASDSYRERVRYRGETAVLTIEASESTHKDATEIVGRLSWDDGWGSDVFMWLDVDGDHGEVPRPGLVIERSVGPLRIRVRVEDVEIQSPGSRASRAIEWIELDVEVYGD